MNKINPNLARSKARKKINNAMKKEALKAEAAHYGISVPALKAWKALETLKLILNPPPMPKWMSDSYFRRSRFVEY